MTLRVMLAHKTNARWEAGERPSEELIRRVGGMIGEMAREGVLEAGEGLRASVHGARLRFADGQRTVEHGPLVGENELLSGFAIVRAASLDDAIDWGTRYAEAVEAAEVDVRLVTEAWDLGMTPPPPAGTPRRYMLMRKADVRSERRAPPSPAARQALRALVAAMREADAFVSMEGFEPSSQATRRRASRAGPTHFDGPFMETKELLAGFVILKLASREAVKGWLDRYAETVEADEVDALVLAPVAD